MPVSSSLFWFCFSKHSKASSSNIKGNRWYQQKNFLKLTVNWQTLRAPNTLLNQYRITITCEECLQMSYSYVKFRIGNKTGPIKLANIRNNNRTDQLIIDSKVIKGQSEVTASTAFLLMAIVIIIALVFYIIFRRRFKKELRQIQNGIEQWICCRYFDFRCNCHLLQFLCVYWPSINSFYGS